MFFHCVRAVELADFHTLHSLYEPYQILMFIISTCFGAVNQ